MQGVKGSISNQLQQALHEYYPAALEAFDDWTHPATWAFVSKWPTPEALKSAGKKYWQKFLHVHRLYRPETFEKRLACFGRATEFCGSPGTTAAKSLLAVSLAKTLQALEKQLEEYRARITKAFEQHPDHDVFGSLPGAGAKIGPRLLAGLLPQEEGRRPQACFRAPLPRATLDQDHLGDVAQWNEVRRGPASAQPGRARILGHRSDGRRRKKGRTYTMTKKQHRQRRPGRAGTSHPDANENTPTARVENSWKRRDGIRFTDERTSPW
jgi:hypothetical protein